MLTELIEVGGVVVVAISGFNLEIQDGGVRGRRVWSR